MRTSEEIQFYIISIPRRLRRSVYLFIVHLLLLRSNNYLQYVYTVIIMQILLMHSVYIYISTHTFLYRSIMQLPSCCLMIFILLCIYCMNFYIQAYCILKNYLQTGFSNIFYKLKSHERQHLFLSSLYTHEICMHLQAEFCLTVIINGQN